MKGYQVLSQYIHHLGNNDSAYEYLLKYNTIKDSIQNKQFLLRIYNSKKDAEAKDTHRPDCCCSIKTNKLKTEQLQQQAREKNLLFILLAVLVMTGIFVYRSIYLKRKKRKTAIRK
jgi:hypothetical protein